MMLFLIYKAERYDIQGKQHLKSLEKYYAVDMGLRQLLLGNRRRDIGHILEKFNSVFAVFQYQREIFLSEFADKYVIVRFNN